MLQLQAEENSKLTCRGKSLSSGCWLMSPGPGSKLWFLSPSLIPKRRVCTYTQVCVTHTEDAEHVRPADTLLVGDEYLCEAERRVEQETGGGVGKSKVLHQELLKERVILQHTGQCDV